MTIGRLHPLDITEENKEIFVQAREGKFWHWKVTYIVYKEGNLYCCQLNIFERIFAHIFTGLEKYLSKGLENREILPIVGPSDLDLLISIFHQLDSIVGNASKDNRSVVLDFIIDNLHETTIKLEQFPELSPDGLETTIKLEQFPELSPDGFGIFLNFFKKMTSLQCPDCSWFTSDHFFQLQNRNLTEFLLTGSDHPIPAEALALLPRSLTSLDLQECDHIASFEFIPKDNLEKLHLSGNRETPFPKLHDAPKLIKVALTDFALTKEGLKQLPPSVKRLGIFCLEDLADDALIGLEHLELETLNLATPKPKNLDRLPKSIRHLRISCEKLTQDILMNLAHLELKSLILHAPTRPESLKPLPKSIKHLIIECKELTPESIADLTEENTPSLQRVDFNKCALQEKDVAFLRDRDVEVLLQGFFDSMSNSKS